MIKSVAQFFTFLLLTIVVGSGTLMAQTLKFIENPDGYKTHGYQGNPIAVGDTMFLRFKNDAGNFVLAKHHSSTGLVFYPSPVDYDANNVGYIGNPVLFNDTLFLRYQNNSSNFTIVKYYGGQLTPVPNASFYSGFTRGIQVGTPVVYKNALYYRVQNNSQNFALAKYENGEMTYYTSPTNHTNANRGYIGNPVVFNDTLFLKYTNNTGSFGNFSLVKFDGTNFTIVPNSIGYNGDNRGYIRTSEPVIYNSNLFIQYQNNTGANVLARYDGSLNEFVTISSPNSYNNNGAGYQGSPVVFQGFLYTRFRHNDGYFNLVRYTGSAFQIIQNPAYMDQSGYGYIGDPRVLNGSIYLNYSGQNLLFDFQIVQFDGTELTFRSNPASYETYGYRGSPLLYQGNLWLMMKHDFGHSDLVKFDQITFTPYSSPNEFQFENKGYQGEPATAGSYMYMRYLTGTDEGRIGYFDVCNGPEITLEPTNKSTCPGFNTSFPLIAANTTSYQWQDSVSNGVWTNMSNAGVFAGTSTSNLRINGATLDLNGRYYRCIAMGSCTFNDTSNTVTATVNTPPSAAVISGDTSVCSGSAGAFKVDITGGTAPYRVTYLASGLGESLVNPYQSGNPISVTTATNRTYTLSQVRDANNCLTLAVNLSGSATVTVDAPVNATASISGSSIVATESAADTYLWLDCNNANAPLPGPENTGSFAPTASGDYAVIVSKGACRDTSACINFVTTGMGENNFTSTLAVYPNPSNGTFTIQSGDANTVTLSVSDLTGRIVYQSASFVPGTALHLPHVGSGIYTIKIVSNDGVVSYTKAVINK